jgi:trigger factor
MRGLFYKSLLLQGEIMKTSIEKKGSLGRKLTIEVPAETVSSTFSRVYKGIQKNANIKGFRQGKAPLQMIKSMYSDKVKQDVLEELINEAYNNALSEHSLNPVTQPQVHFEKLEEATVFNFTAEFEVRPDIQIRKIEKLKVEKEKLEVKEEKIEGILKQIRESRAKLVPVFEDRPAQAGDTAEIDFVGTVEGKPLDGGTMNGYKLELGSNSFIPGFEDGILGMRPGSNKVLNLNFPPDYGHKEIAGKPVQFSVSLKNIMKKDLPPLDEEFVKSMGPFENLDALKKAISEDVLAEEGKRVHDELKTRLLKVLVKENPIEVPPTLKAKQKELIIADVEERTKRQGMTPTDFEEYKKKWDHDFDETAEFVIQTHFLIDTLAEEHKLVPTKAEIDERLQTYAQQSGIELPKVREFYLKNMDRMNQLVYQITEEKVVNFLIEKADIQELPKDKISG